jgi:peptidoglycan/xylan/chitin deacetylase (PgdA/CDA1 family)
MKIWPSSDIVPVLTFHSVGMHEPSWVWSQLSERADAFEGLLRRLSSNGYQAITLSQLYAHMSGEAPCRAKSVVLVFDDGYLDNWVTVYPLLRKYGFRGTVYVNPEFVDPGVGTRPTLDDTDHRADPEAGLQQTGFMNWDELRHLDHSGVLDVQSHSLTHTWYFTGPTIDDFYSPASASAYPWMAWNQRPDRKPFYIQEDQTGFVPWGVPVFEHEKSLVARRFFPDSKCVEEIAGYVASNGAPEFFESGDWEQKLRAVIREITGASEFPGTYESESDYEVRVRDELARSKAIIERELGKTVDFLCWPGGGVNAAAKRLAAEAGYRSWTLPSIELPAKRNRPGAEPMEIRRLPALRDVLFLGKKWGMGSDRLVYLAMLSHQESAAFDLLSKCYKLAAAFGVAGKH